MQLLHKDSTEIVSVLILELSISLWAGRMEGVQAIANVVARGALQSAAAASSAAAATVTTQPACASDNNYDGRIGVRVSAIFVILVGSMFGTLSRHSRTHSQLDH